MAYRKTPAMSAEMKTATLTDLRRSRRAAQTAHRSFCAEIRDALTHGFTTRELGEALGVSGNTVGRWNRSGI